MRVPALGVEPLDPCDSVLLDVSAPFGCPFAGGGQLRQLFHARLEAQLSHFGPGLGELEERAAGV